jgi:hypothetical protein
VTERGLHPSYSVTQASDVLWCGLFISPLLVIFVYTMLISRGNALRAKTTTSPAEKNHEISLFFSTAVHLAVPFLASWQLA